MGFMLTKKQISPSVVHMLPDMLREADLKPLNCMSSFSYATIWFNSAACAFTEYSVLSHIRRVKCED